MKKWIGYLGVACALIAILYMIFSDKDTSSVHIKAADGILDLREMSDSPFVSLAGDWKFTDNSFVAPDDFSKKADDLPVPGPWTPNTQWGSYQLTVYLPDHWSDVGLRVRNIWSAHTIYIDGEIVAEQGKTAVTKQETVPSNPSYEAYFKPDSRQILITIHASNFYNARGGIVLPIDIGDAESIKKDVERDLALEWAAVLCLLLFGMYHLTIYLLRTKDEAFLYSGLYFLVLAFVIAFRGERMLLREFPSFPFELYFRLQDAITYLSPILLLYFIVKMIPSAMKRRTLILLLLPLLVYASLNVILPARTLSGIQYPFFYYMDVLFLVVIARIGYLTIKNRISIRRNEAVILISMLLFLAIFAISGSSDSLFFSGRNSWNRIGLIGSVLSMNVFLGIRLMNRTEESERLTVRLQKANDTKDDFLKVATQDLQKPLHDAIHLIKSIARERNHHKQGEQLYLAEQLIGNMVYVLRDLNDFTRIRFDDYAIQLRSTNLQMVMHHALQLMQLTFAKKKIHIDEKISKQLYVWADEQALAQVLLRMMTEIAQDTAEDSLTIEAVRAGTDILLHVETTRKAIATSGDRQHSSGLMMTVELVQQMNGSIKYKRTENSITCTLKLAFSEYKEPDTFTGHNYHLQAAASAEERELQTLLIVDDDVIHGEVMRGILSDTYKIRIAYTAQEALDYYSNHPDISMIMIDDIIPGSMNSLELLQKIRLQSSLMELPILMMISSEYPRHIETIFASGANDYIIKPFSKETLMARLNAVEQTKQSMQKAIEYEMAFLQTQIKPHFLYNALSNIISFCYTDGERAAYLLTMLSSFLRYIFETSRDGQFSTVQKELEIIEAYVEVEKARFGERLTFAYDIDPLITAESIRIPSLLLQPLVENAIRHGLFDKEGPGHVQVSIYKHESLLHIQVSDDGVGMTTERRAQLMEGGTANVGIGFTNVRRRVLDLTQGSLDIEALPGKGTTIQITIPIKEGLHDVESYSR
ncbi:histidine kinase [Paenibacillus radicis (ex Gao et al. 2016)]|uniref:histidine kinase n=1 Tax=Paenibacillus radicis (ex Gao et al. 2016) TaxID=1737354 RepID=A0A917M5G8_9BACL|nr:histidine kinase [Paenibacillus radicis (ex Gao et al. 2016)]GGG78363.1 histidine kinase [Paenibacillus radicis (ex Gao et al. 2016)]